MSNRLSTLKSSDEEFDKALREVMEELNSGELYRKQLAAMKECGIDPDKPLVLGFADGSQTIITPRKSISHLKEFPKKSLKVSKE